MKPSEIKKEYQLQQWAGTVKEQKESGNNEQEICKEIGIKKDNIICGHMSLLYNPLRIIKNANNTIRMISEIRKCDCIIDITGGDSFLTYMEM